MKMKVISVQTIATLKSAPTDIKSGIFEANDKCEIEADYPNRVLRVTHIQKPHTFVIPFELATWTEMPDTGDAKPKLRAAK